MLNDLLRENMKKSLYPLAAIVLCLVTAGPRLLGQTTLSTNPPPAGLGPEIAFETPDYDFGQVNMGTLVKHVYVFTNTGDALLVVSAVQPHCGCTTAGDWTHQVEPGQTGSIPIQVNTVGMLGSPITKTVQVNSNARQHPSMQIMVHGKIWRPLEVTPLYAVFNLHEDAASNATMVVKLHNNTEEAVTVVSPPESNNQHFTAAIRTNVPGKDYDVIVQALAPFTGERIQGQITIRTSSKEMSAIPIVAMVNLQPAISVNPREILIPPDTTNRFYMTRVTLIQNYGEQPLSVSAASVNSEKVDVQVDNPVGGQQCNLQLHFPKGFEIPAGTELALSVKTSNPHAPVLKVPIKMKP